MISNERFLMSAMTFIDGEPTLYGVVDSRSPVLAGEHVVRHKGSLLVANSLSNKPDDERPTEIQAISDFVRQERIEQGIETPKRKPFLGVEEVRNQIRESRHRS
jgi:hypothetical protein